MRNHYIVNLKVQFKTKKFCKTKPVSSGYLLIIQHTFITAATIGRRNEGWLCPGHARIGPDSRLGQRSVSTGGEFREK